MTHVVVVGPNLRNQDKGDFHVHAKGCADLHRDPVVRREDQSFVIEVESKLDVVEAVYPPEEFGYDPAEEAGDYLSDIYFAPCTGLA